MEANLTIYESNNTVIFSTSANKVLSEHHINRGAPNNASSEREKSNCELYPNRIMTTNNASYVPFDELPLTLMTLTCRLRLNFYPILSFQIHLSGP